MRKCVGWERWPKLVPADPSGQLVTLVVSW